MTLFAVSILCNSSEKFFSILSSSMGGGGEREWRMRRRKIEREMKRMRNETREENSRKDQVSCCVSGRKDWMSGRKDWMSGRKDWMSGREYDSVIGNTGYIKHTYIYFWSKTHFNVEFEM